jgi:hypothetical protein
VGRGGWHAWVKEATRLVIGWAGGTAGAGCVFGQHVVGIQEGLEIWEGIG